MSVPITSSVARYARERPAAAAVIEVGPGGSQRSWTFAELDAAARRWSATLAGLGVRAGEPVAYQLPNVLDFAALSLGTLMLGAVCEPLMPIFRERELAFMLRASGARVLVVPGTFRGHDHAATATALRDELPSLRHVVALDDMPPEPPATPSLTDPRPEMTAQLLFTSGSTGEPKGVLQTHASLDRAAA
ncbi:MAG: AMP-binding protein, partial [Actinomycetota bacterium]|nr:AMP-binding protein [Actinomycetota bacterium]